MPDWIAEHRSSIQFATLMIVGVALIAAGVLVDNEHGLIALGATAIGLPGFASASRGRE